MQPQVTPPETNSHYDGPRNDQEEYDECRDADPAAPVWLAAARARAGTPVFGGRSAPAGAAAAPVRAPSLPARPVRRRHLSLGATTPIDAIRLFVRRHSAG